ncbi:MAG: hypothetical protein IKO49_07110 [Bacilli bacterium]|nr:hypothetical protein [Bacilli bacterium]
MKKYNRRRYKSRGTKRKLYLVLVFFLLVSIGLGYAYLQSVLSITGTTKISKNSWNVHFANLVSSDNTKVSLVGDTKVSLNVTLSPGESFWYKVDAVNSGTIDAKIGSITPITIPAAYQDVVEYSLNYDKPAAGEEISVNDVLKHNTTEPIKFEIKYKDGDNLENDVEEVTLNLNFTINYVQADNNITEVAHNYPVCKKAETLNTETCNSNSGYGCRAKGYAQGAIITYGHTDSSKLTNGQLTNGQSGGYALDCDVSGNGDYERFYYVSDLYTGTVDGTDQFDSNYAVLIYHKNIGTSGTAYYYENSAIENWHGPVTLLPSLPTRSTWANENINLKSTSRTIVNEQGAATTDYGSNTIENPFNYTDRVARLLTVQEINKSCGGTVGSFTNGELDSCEYLMEDSAYSKTSGGCSGGACYYWLETSYVSNDFTVWEVYGDSRDLENYHVDFANGVRPVIEVLKTDISLE